MALGQTNVAGAIGGSLEKDYAGPCRDKVQAIVAQMVTQHQRELAGWNYLQLVMAKEPPNAAEEAALWEILNRARRERY